MKRRLPIFLGLVALVLLAGHTVRAAVINHIVISEVQVAGVTTSDEFVELYNPTLNPISLDGWRLRQETAGGTATNLVASLSGTIPGHGFFLIANPNYTGTTTPDQQYPATSSGIANDNSVLLYSDAGITLVDQVGMGTATASGATVATPASNGSVERKANSSSTAPSMANLGADELLGNGEDTNNHAADFVVQSISHPQNSLSSQEPVCPSTFGCETPTPTLSPTVTSSPSPTPTPSASPSTTPTPTALPTTTPALTPTVTPTPNHFPHLTCTVTRRTFKILGSTFTIPFVSCHF